MKKDNLNPIFYSYQHSSQKTFNQLRINTINPKKCLCIYEREQFVLKTVFFFADYQILFCTSVVIRYEKRDVQVYHKNDLSDKSSDWVSYKRPIEKPIEVKVEESSLLSSPLPKVTDESVAEVDICEQTDSTQKVLDKSRPPQADTDFSSEKITSPKSLDKKESIGTGLSYKRKQGEKKFSGRCRLFVANLNNNTSEKDLRDLFAPFGESGEVYVNNQKGFGFIRLVC